MLLPLTVVSLVVASWLSLSSLLMCVSLMWSWSSSLQNCVMISSLMERLMGRAMRYTRRISLRLSNVCITSRKTELSGSGQPSRREKVFSFEWTLSTINYMTENNRNSQMRLTNQIYHLSGLDPHGSMVVLNSQTHLADNKTPKKSLPSEKPKPNGTSKPNKPVSSPPLTQTQQLKAQIRNLQTKVSSLVTQNSILRSTGSLGQDNQTIQSLTKLCESSNQQLVYLRQQNTQMHQIISELQAQWQARPDTSERSFSLSERLVDSPSLRRKVVQLTDECMKMKQELMGRIREFEKLREEQTRNQREVGELFEIIEEKDRIIEKLLQKMEGKDEQKPRTIYNYQYKQQKSPPKTQKIESRTLNNHHYRKVAWVDKDNFQ